MTDACSILVRREVEDMTDAELDDLLDELKRRQRTYMAGGLSSQDAGQKAAQSIGDDLKRAAAIEKRNAAINRRIRLEAVDFVRTQFGDRPWEGLTALLAGSNRAGVGTRMSVDAVQDALRGQYLAGLIGDLERSGLFEAFRTGALDEDVARALWAIDSPDALKRLPKPAQAIAAIIRRWQEKARVDANRAGAWIGKVDGYIVRQSHDADRMLRGGFEAWRDAIMPRLDLGRMFPDGPPENLGDWLQEAYTGLVTGIHESLPGDKAPAFKGPGNLAKKLSQGRVLHFKSADDWFAYNREYGTGNIREAVVMGLSRSADATGLMRVLGTNPEGNLQSIYDAVRGQLRKAGNVEALRTMEARGNPSQGWLHYLYQEVSGRSGAAVGRALSTWGSAIRGWNNMSSLGGAVLSAVTDIPVAATEMRYQGQNFLGSIARQFVAPLQKALASAGSKAERRAILAELGYAAEAMTGLLSARFSAVDSVVGTMTSAQRQFFRLSGLTAWTDVMREAALLATSGHLGHLGELAHDALPEATSRLLSQYGIGAKEWEVLRGAVREWEGKTLLSPEAVRDMDRRKFSDLAAERINDLKAGLANRVARRLAQDEREREWVAKRAAKLDERLTAARVRIKARLEAMAERKKAAIEARAGRQMEAGEERLAKASQAAYDRLVEIEEAMTRAQLDMDAANAFWTYGVRGSDEVREIGKRAISTTMVDKGRALESMQALKKAAADIERSLKRAHDELPKEVAATAGKAERKAGRQMESLRKELNTDLAGLTERWQEDLAQFADDVSQRINQRAKQNAEDFANLGPAVDRALEDAREALAVRLQTLLIDRMNYAIISPDARAKAFINRGTRRGTAPGEIARAVGQFKSFGIGFTQRTFGRELYGRGARRLRDIRSQEIRGLASLIVSTTAFGYLAMTAKDLAKGKTPRSPDDWKTWAAAMQQGGGFGIYGDFLFGEASRFGNSPLATLAGPSIGKFEDAWNLIQSAKQGKDPSAKAFRFLVSNAPFVNLFYTKLALDYFVFWQIQEALNPGYLRRMERRAEQETGQEFLLRPTEAAR